jgi:hypothetical protein
MSFSQYFIVIPHPSLPTSFTALDTFAMFGIPIRFLFLERGMTETSKATDRAGRSSTEEMIDSEKRILSAHWPQHHCRERRSVIAHLQLKARLQKLSVSSILRPQLNLADRQTRGRKVAIKLDRPGRELPDQDQKKA